jgi:hypothetical protein
MKGCQKFTRLRYQSPGDAASYLQALGASISLFLGSKGLLTAPQLRLEVAPFVQAVSANPGDVRAQLALVTALQRLKAFGAPGDDEALTLARTWLASDEAQGLGMSGIEL